MKRRETGFLPGIGPAPAAATVFLMLVCAVFSPSVRAGGDWRLEWNARMAAAEEAWTGSPGDTETAEHEYRAALDLAEGHLPEGLYAARSLDALGYFLLREKRYEEAESFYLRSIPLLGRLLGTEQPRVANSIHNLGVLYIRQGRNEEAEPLVRQALAIFTRSFGPNHPETARAYRSLSVLMRRAGLDAEADRLEAKAKSGFNSHGAQAR